MNLQRNVGHAQSSVSWFITGELFITRGRGHVRLNVQFCLILERSCQRLIHSACEMALHPTSCAEITHTVVFPNMLWLSNDPVLHHFREPTQHLFFQLERPFHFPPWQHEDFAEYSHLQSIDKQSGMDIKTRYFRV